MASFTSKNLLGSNAKQELPSFFHYKICKVSGQLHHL